LEVESGAGCPIAIDSLSAVLQKSVGPSAPAPVRMMAARGMAPMAPKDLVTAQFVLTYDQDVKVAEAAAKSLANLDERIANAVLSDTNLSHHVLGHLAITLATKDAFAEKLLLNPSTPSGAFIEAAKVASENICELIANNQARLLEQPEIARSLTKNTQALKSTIDRVVDFLVRSSVFLEGVPEFEQALLRLTGEERMKAADNVALPAHMLDERVLTDEQKKELEQQGRRLIEDEGDELTEPTEDQKVSIEKQLRGFKIGDLVALATKGKREYRRYLLRHANPMIALAAISSPLTKEGEVVAAANSRMVHQDVIAFISREKEWTRMYSVKLALAQNPKTQLPTAMKFVQLLHKKDIRVISKSKNVPMGVRNLAMKLAKDGD
jgi:hypothetical protein